MNSDGRQDDLGILGELRPLHPDRARSVRARAQAQAALRARARRHVRRRAFGLSIQPLLVAAIPLVFLIVLIRELWRAN